MGRCLGAGIVVGLIEGGIVVMGGNIVVKALGGKVDVVSVCAVMLLWVVLSELVLR